MKVQPQVNFLDHKQIRVLHLAALEILERTGVIVHCGETVDLLASAGCKVSDKNHVRIPANLVEVALKDTPSKVTIYNRLGERTMALEGRNSYWGTGSDTPFTLDYQTERRRKTCLEDIRNFSVIVDALDNLDFLMCMGVAHELPASIADKYHFVSMVSNTIKPLVFTASSRENLIDIYHMACEITGGEDKFQEEPFIVLFTQPQAPLIHPKDSLGKMAFAVEHGIPVIYACATTCGQNGPVTLAGSIALSAARNLSGLVIAQLRHKGAKVITTLHASSMDPRNAIHTYSSPEHVIGQATARSLLEYYGVPTWGRAGCSESKVLDQQAAFEAGYEILMQALCGENLIHDVGYLESGLTSSLGSLVMCNEFIGAAKRVVNGFELAKHSLALDLIHKVGPEGHFMAEMHTAENIRKEFWAPELFDRSIFQNWQNQGSLDMSDRIKKKIQRLLKTYKPQPLGSKLKSFLNELAQKKNG